MRLTVKDKRWLDEPCWTACAARGFVYRQMKIPVGCEGCPKAERFLADAHAFRGTKA